MERAKGEARQATGRGLAAGMMEGAVMRVLGSLRGTAGSWLGVGVMCMAGAVVAWGQTPCEINGKYLPLDEPAAAAATSGVGINSEGAYFWDSGFESVGWKPLVWDLCDTPDSVQLPAGNPRGFRLGINLMASPSPGNYLPPSPTLGSSSMALLPPGASGAPTAWRDIGRPTLHGRVDLVTGLPLIQTNSSSQQSSSA